MVREEVLGSFRYRWTADCFPLGRDSLELGAFATVRPRWRICDLGCGGGLLLLLLAARAEGLTLAGVEQSPSAAEAARANLRQNGLCGTVLTGNLREGALPAGSWDLAVSNPPYFAPHTGAVAEGARGDARAELTATLEDIFAAAERMLQWGGRFCLVYRPERLAALLTAAVTHGLEPKRLQMVQHTARSAPSLVLLECRRGGKPGLSVEPPLLLRLEDGGESHDVRRAYFRDKE